MHLISNKSAIVILAVGFTVTSHAQQSPPAPQAPGAPTPAAAPTPAPEAPAAAPAPTPEAPAAAAPQAAGPKTVEEELKPQPALGDRSLSVLSPEAQKILRERLMKESERVAPPVPRETKRAMFDQMLATTPMSMRELFNFMTSKKKARAGLKFDEVIEAMDLKANDVNFKKVGHNKFWKDVSAITGLPAARVEILQYCDAVIGRRMLDYSPEFVVFIPCRIAVYEDANGEIWLMTLDWDVSWLAKAWHPDSQLSEQLKKDALRIRNAMEAIMNAGAKGEW
jgi:uncharacterized protein (DUF302 family)